MTAIYIVAAALLLISVILFITNRDPKSAVMMPAESRKRIAGYVQAVMRLRPAKMITFIKRRK